MSDTDRWGRDPGVQRMRQVFAAMEDAQRGLVRRAGLSLFDPRLPKWRSRALARFERVWATDPRGGSDRGAGELYLSCLETELAADGIFSDTSPARSESSS